MILHSYNNFAITDEKVHFWLLLLQGVPFERAKKNVLKYCLNPENKFPPHPGILADTGEQAGPYIRSAEETRLYLQQRERELMEPVTPIPERVKERMKLLGQSKHTVAGTN